jgi:hypothetical protein
MADESNTPSAEEPSAQSTETASEVQAEQPSGSPSWWRRLIGGRRGGDEELEEEAPAKPKEPEPSKLVLTQEELDRRIQAETDRREAKRQREQQLAERKRLRDEDPWKYAEEERKAEQAAVSDQSMMQLFASIGVEHDKVTIDPVFQKLPEADRERILKMEGAGHGLEGRALLVNETLKALEKHWRTQGEKDAEQKLRRNPAFRKQVLAESRGQYTEPELLPSGPAGNGRSSDDINDMLRRQIGIHRET